MSGQRFAIRGEVVAEEAARAGRPTLDLPAGVEPGLRFAVVLDGKGGCVELDWQGVAAWKPEQGFLWVHLERDAPEAQAWVMGPSGIDPLIAEALIAEDYPGRGLSTSTMRCCLSCAASISHPAAACNWYRCTFG